MSTKLKQIEKLKALFDARKRQREAQFRMAKQHQDALAQQAQDFLSQASKSHPNEGDQIDGVALAGYEQYATLLRKRASQKFSEAEAQTPAVLEAMKNLQTALQREDAWKSIEDRERKVQHKIELDAEELEREQIVQIKRFIKN